MNKKRIIMLVCIIILFVTGTVYYFQFTLSGENLLYDIFGGNNLHIAANGRELYWFDVRHSNDPNAPIFQRIEHSLTDFSPDLVLVEGGFQTFEGNRDAAIQEGEAAFAAYLAKQNEISVEDIEPPLTKQLEYLQSKYPAEHIFAMFLIRQISSKQFAPDNSQWDFSTELLHMSRSLKDNGLNYHGESLDDILYTVNAFLPEPVNADNWRDIDRKKMSKVYQSSRGALNPIYNDIYHYRNIYLIDLIKEKLNRYDKIYIVMGGSHLTDTKEELRKYLCN